MHINLTSRTNNFLMHFLLSVCFLFFANCFREQQKAFATWWEVLDAVKWERRLIEMKKHCKQED